MTEHAIKVHESLFSSFRDTLLKSGYKVTTEPEKNTIIVSSELAQDYFNFGKIYEQVKQQHERNHI